MFNGPFSIAMLNYRRVLGICFGICLQQGPPRPAGGSSRGSHPSEPPGCFDSMRFPQGKLRWPGIWPCDLLGIIIIRVYYDITSMMIFTTWLVVGLIDYLQWLCLDYSLIILLPCGAPKRFLKLVELSPKKYSPLRTIDQSYGSYKPT